MTGVPTAAGTMWPATGWPMGAPPYMPTIPGCFIMPPGGPPSAAGAWPVMGGTAWAALLMLVMSWMLERRRSRFMELRRMKYFCAWLATC
uniref:Uncharacterized protein n=1 Tax=Triticum urartu TaxID=4572 RepID=A0A8R7V1H5_TRIUA